MSFDIGTGMQGGQQGAETGFMFGGGTGAIIGGVIGTVAGGILGGKAKKAQKKAQAAMRKMQIMQRRVAMSQAVNATVTANAAVAYGFSNSGAGKDSSGVQGMRSSVLSQGLTQQNVLKVGWKLEDTAAKYAAKAQGYMSTFNMLASMAKLAGDIKGAQGKNGQKPSGIS